MAISAANCVGVEFARYLMYKRQGSGSTEKIVSQIQNVMKVNNALPQIQVGQTVSGSTRKAAVLDNGLWFDQQSFVPINYVSNRLIGVDTDQLTISVWVYIVRELSMSQDKIMTLMCHGVKGISGKSFDGHACWSIAYLINRTLTFNVGHISSAGISMGRQCLLSKLNRNSWVLATMTCKLGTQSINNCKCTNIMHNIPDKAETSSTNWSGHNMGDYVKQEGLGAMKTGISSYKNYFKGLIHQISFADNKMINGPTNLEKAAQFLQFSFIANRTQCPVKCRRDYLCVKQLKVDYGQANSCIDDGGTGSWIMNGNKIYNSLQNRNRDRAPLQFDISDSRYIPAQTNFGWMNYGDTLGPRTKTFKLKGRSLTLEIICTPIGDDIVVQLTYGSQYRDIRFLLQRQGSSRKMIIYSTDEQQKEEWGDAEVDWFKPMLLVFTISPTLNDSSYFQVCYGVQNVNQNARIDSNTTFCISTQQDFISTSSQTKDYYLVLRSPYVFFHQVRFYEYPLSVEYVIKNHNNNPCYEHAQNCTAGFSDQQFDNMIKLYRQFNESKSNYTNLPDANILNPQMYNVEAGGTCDINKGLVKKTQSIYKTPFCYDECRQHTPRNPLQHYQCDDGNINPFDNCNLNCVGKPSVCGNNQLESGEQCEDQNTNDNDGCSSTCQRETGYICDTNQMPNVCNPECQDGLVIGQEKCDDNNNLNNDGCSQSCQVETGWDCTLASPSVCTPICQDGLVMTGEECDDNNNVANDGCTPLCKKETGWNCDASQPTQCQVICGDGLVRGTEQCDDNDKNDGDGCSSQCKTETGWKCDQAEPSVCTPKCQDGLVRGNEKCDDQNNVNMDGCSTGCTIETGWDCDGNEPTNCVPICKDGLIRGTEVCDDGDDKNGNGCSSKCQVETGWNCNTAEPSKCTAKCQDGLTRGAELCDDGNNIAGDGCSQGCTVETGWTCTKADPSSCTPKCQDGLTRGNEICDDGNSLNGDGCSTTCTQEQGWSCTKADPSQCSTTCKDGFKRGTEECDDKNNINGDGCTQQCKVELGWQCDNSDPSVCKGKCGDGQLINNEPCDDGNTVSLDGCDSSCQVELGWKCTGTPSQCQAKCQDGIKIGAEGCDDQNNQAGDGCSVSCQVEAGWTCDNSNPSKCTPICGDSLLKGSEKCDDANSNPDDGCSATCQIESGWKCPNVGQSCTSTCGDGVIVGQEKCDDGNTTPNDGCTSSCLVIQQGYKCPTPNKNCEPICGDGLNKGAEQCDDSNSNSNDGCSSTCVQEVGFVCPTTGACTPICGDGLKRGSEACDDGGKIDGDGCKSDCTQVENGYYCPTEGKACNTQCGDGKRAGAENCDDGSDDNVGCLKGCTGFNNQTCSGGTPTTPDKCQIVCGDSMVYTPEQCDDGGRQGNDGCSIFCTIEYGWECPGTCKPIQCGDGKLALGSEICDDSNKNDTDGCPNNCTGPNFGYSCSGTKVSVCKSTCQDGKRASDEDCDDGNDEDGDGCSKTCQTEAGWKCKGKDPDICGPLCGNGLILHPETCDDGNAIDGIGCKSDCSGPMDGYTCDSGSPSICKVVCGDGKRIPPEVCDDGNTDDYDGCTSDCTTIEPFYKCVGGSPTSQDTCEEFVCGNKKTQTDEVCDDGNTINGDGCDNKCQVEKGFFCTNNGALPDLCLPFCGNGVRDGNEVCDDGNYVGMDGCDSTCKVEGGYVCKGGSHTSIDKCTTDIPPPYPVFQTPKSDSKFVYKWNTTMEMNMIQQTYFDVKLEGPDVPYDLEWTGEWLDNRHIQISIKLNSPLIGGGIETLFISFKELYPFVSTQKRILQDNVKGNYTFQYLIPSVNAKKTATSTEKVLMASTLSLAILQLVGGGSMEALWAILNSCQLIYYLALISLYLPIHVVTMFKVLAFANMDNILLKKLTQLLYNPEVDIENREDPVNYRFDNLDISAKSLIDNSADAVPLIVICSISLILVGVLTLIPALQRIKYIGKAVHKILDFFKYGFMLRICLELYLELTLASTVNIFYSNPAKNHVQLVSFIFAIIMLVIIMLFTLFTGVYLIKNHKGITLHPSRYSNFAVLFEEFKTTKLSQICFNLFFLIRRFIFILILVGAIELPRVQCVIVLQSSIFVAVYQYVQMPYKSKLLNILGCINETLMVVACLSILFFLKRKQDIQTSLYIGWFMIGAVVFTLLLNLCLVLPMQVIQTVKSIQTKIYKLKKMLNKVRHVAKQKTENGLDTKEVKSEQQTEPQTTQHTTTQLTDASIMSQFNIEPLPHLPPPSNLNSFIAQDITQGQGTQNTIPFENDRADAKSYFHKMLSQHDQLPRKESQIDSDQFMNDANIPDYSDHQLPVPKGRNNVVFRRHK